MCAQVGDASASQSPLSFGGFGSMLHNLPRLAAGLGSALDHNRLFKADLKLLQVDTVLGVLHACINECLRFQLCRLSEVERCGCVAHDCVARKHTAFV
jgi:hypothetical protein